MIFYISISYIEFNEIFLIYTRFICIKTIELYIYTLYILKIYWITAINISKGIKILFTI
jgi:hypothetical protein